MNKRRSVTEGRLTQACLRVRARTPATWGAELSQTQLRQAICAARAFPSESLAWSGNCGLALCLENRASLLIVVLVGCYLFSIGLQKPN